jgi:hypothetical protein
MDCQGIVMIVWYPHTQVMAFYNIVPRRRNGRAAFSKGEPGWKKGWSRALERVMLRSGRHFRVAKRSQVITVGLVRYEMLVDRCAHVA